MVKNTWIRTRWLVGVFCILAWCNINVDSQTAHQLCGFPGAPANGRVNVSKNSYRANEKVGFLCDSGYDLNGPDWNRCKSSGEWERPLPLCDRNLAFNEKTWQSSDLSSSARSDLAVDGNRSTCSSSSDFYQHRPKPSWTIQFQKNFTIQKIRIQATLRSSSNHYFSVSISIADLKNNHIGTCNAISVSNKRDIDETTTCILKTSARTFPWSLTITDERGFGRLILCEVKIYSDIVVECGDPDFQPNCKVETRMRGDNLLAVYSANHGYFLRGKEHRLCKEGKWSDSPPLCLELKDEKIDNNTADGTKFLEDKKVIIGIAVGVTTASISTICVITIVICIMRKFYRRNQNPPCSVISEQEGMFLHMKPPSSCGSVSPTIHQNYSDPWDDPRNHTYEYITTESLMRNKGKGETSFSSGTAPKLDGGNYLVPHRKGRPSDDDRTARESLMEPHVSVRIREPSERRRLPFEPSTSTRGVQADERAQSVNELEVDAYGYNPNMEVQSRM